MSVMLSRSLVAERGIVESVSDALSMRCVFRRADGSLFECALPARLPPVQQGEDVSVIFRDRSKGGAVLGLVNHTVVDGENYVRLMARRRPDAWDGVLVSAAFVGATSALGTDGLVLLALLAALYAVLGGILPMARRERLARRVDRLIDREAHNRGTALRSIGTKRTGRVDGEPR